MLSPWPGYDMSWCKEWMRCAVEECGELLRVGCWATIGWALTSWVAYYIYICIVSGAAVESWYILFHATRSQPSVCASYTLPRSSKTHVQPQKQTTDNIEYPGYHADMNRNKMWNLGRRYTISRHEPIKNNTRRFVKPEKAGSDAAKST